MINLKKQKGFGILFIAFVLAFMAGITYFLLLNRSLARLNIRILQHNSQAEELLEQGFGEMVNQLQDCAGNDLTFSGTGLYTLVTGVGTALVSVIDEQSKINLRVPVENNPEVELAYNRLVENLLDSRGVPPSTSIKALEITAYAVGTGFNSINDLLLVDQFDAADFDLVRDFVTVHSFVDTQGTGVYAFEHNGLAPVNINTAGTAVLEAVLSSFGGSDPAGLAADLINNRPFNNWTEFNAFIDSKVPADLLAAEAQDIKDNVNPNVRITNKPNTPVTFTTEFCFFSGGRFTLLGTATVYSAAGNILAQKVKRRMVKVHDVFFQTTGGTTGDFATNYRPPLASPPDPIEFGDSCPVEISTDKGTSYIYSTVSDSIKMGIWINNVNVPAGSSRNIPSIGMQGISRFSLRGQCSPNGIGTGAIKFNNQVSGDYLEAYFEPAVFPSIKGTAVLATSKVIGGMPPPGPPPSHILEKASQPPGRDYPLTYKLIVEDTDVNNPYPAEDVRFYLAEGANDYDTVNGIEYTYQSMGVVDPTSGEILLVSPGDSVDWENLRLVPDKVTYIGSADIDPGFAPGSFDFTVGAYGFNQEDFGQPADTSITFSPPVRASLTSISYTFEALSSYPYIHSPCFTDLTVLYLPPAVVLDEEQIFPDAP